jgi:NAD(P)-dependent dehydrogenase (short-subunit alcohol dehydrogenase family)
VTGASDGLGFETARQLAQAGHDVLVHGRSAERAGGACAALSAGGSSGRLQAVWGDLSRMGEVVELARQCVAIAPALDVVIHNAGSYPERRRLTEDGFESTRAVNHFAPFLLTRRLLSALERAGPARVVVVSSGTHHSGRLALDDLAGERGWTPYGAYANSKLANVLLTQALARRLARTPITANALHPGVIATKLLRAGLGAGGASPSQGARTPVFLATSPAVARICGRFFVDCRETPPSAAAQDVRGAEALWGECERCLKAFCDD